MHSEPNEEKLLEADSESGAVQCLVVLPLTRAAINQYFYKLSAYSGYLCGLVAVQLIGAFFALGGTVSSISATYSYHYYSGLIPVLFSEFWALVVSVLFCTRGEKSEAFALPANRLSDALSDIGYLVTGCLFGGVTSTLSCIALRIPVYLQNKGILIENGFAPDFAVFFTILASTALYMLFFSAIGYLCGSLVRLHKAFLLLLPAIAAGAIVLETNSRRSQTLFRECWDSIINEHSLALFAVRVLALSALMLAVSVILANRVEVKK